MDSGERKSEHDVEIAAQRERANWMARRYGLPTVGTVLVNKFGIKWVVEAHATVPTVDTLVRWRAAEIEPDRDMYPAVMPQNLSPLLTEFIAAIDRCTTKSFTILDTMPGRRNDGHVPGANYIDTVCHPTTNFLFLDAARVHETIIAHEFGHAWVQYVDDCEDFRTLASAEDPQKVRLVGHVQSFILDLKVNDLLRRKGFDMSVIEEDQVAGLANLAAAALAGYRPEHPKESVFMALLLADALLARERNQSTDLVRLDSSLEVIGVHLAQTAGLARALAESVNKHGYDTRDAIIRCIDECLLASFEHTSEPFEADSELTAVNPPEPNQDKFPNWLPQIPPKSKCVAGKHMARNDISSEWSHHVDPTITSRARVSFQSPDGERRSNVVLYHEIRPPTRYSGLPEAIAENLAMKHFIQTGTWQTHGGPPHPGNPSHDYDPRPPAIKPRRPTSPQQPAPPVPGRPVNSPVLPGRPYMAGLGRFLTAARLQEQLEGEHAYSYAFNNPMSYVDPSGLTPKQCERCAYLLGGMYFLSTTHDCNHKFIHCFVCCVLSHEMGASCAIDMQEIQNKGDDPAKARRRMAACGHGIAGDVPTNQCANHCATIYPNPDNSKTSCIGHKPDVPLGGHLPGVCYANWHPGEGALSRWWCGSAT